MFTFQADPNLLAHVNAHRVPGTQIKIDASVLDQQLGAWANSMSGLGGGGPADPVSAFGVLVGAPTLTPQELASMWIHNGLAGRICSLRPTWLAAADWTVSAEGAPGLWREEEDLSFRAHLSMAQTWANLFRGGVILMLPHGQHDLSLPMDPVAVRASGGIREMVTIDGNCIMPYQFPDLSTSLTPEPGLHPIFHGESRIGLPKFWQLVGGRYIGAYTGAAVSKDGNQVAPAAVNGPAIHWTWVLDFYGQRLPPWGPGLEMILQNGAWPSVSRLDPVYSALRSYAATCLSSERAGQILASYVLEITDIQAMLGGDDTGSVESKLLQVKQRLALTNILVAMPGTELKSVSLNLSGLDKILDGAYMTIGAATGDPLVLLFGPAPSGLSADTTSWETNFKGTLRGEFDRDWRPMIKRRYKIAAFMLTGQDLPIVIKPPYVPVVEATKAETPAAPVEETGALVATDEAPIAGATHGEKMAAHLNEIGAAACGHKRTNACPYCQVRGLRYGVRGEDGAIVYTTKWEAMGAGV